MTRHVAILAWLYRVWGAVFGVAGLSGLLLAAGAAALAGQSGPLETRASLAAGVTAAVMAILAALAVAWAGLHLWVSWRLPHHAPHARLGALALGVVDLGIFPFGTALGIYACWVLLRESGRAVFHPPAPAPAPPDGSGSVQ